MKNICLISILLFCLSGCALLQPKAVSVSESDVINNENLVEVSPDNYFEFIGLKKFTAEQIVDSMRAKQIETITGNKALHACSSVMKRDLGFEYVSPQYVNPNYSFITIIESKKNYGITEKEFPSDSLETNTDWNIDGKDLNNFSNKIALSFFLQFLRTDGNKLSMKMKLIYNQFASAEEKEFTDGLLTHVNSLDMNEALPQARKTLQSDGNRVNRYWALLIMMRNKPTDDDLALIFDQFNYNDHSLKTYSTYILRETLKIREDVKWNLYRHDIKNIISGVSVWNYDELLKILVKHYSDSNNSQYILNPSSPLLMDYLNAHLKKKSELAFNFIQQVSPEKIDNKKEANEWLASQYQIISVDNSIYE